MSKRAYSDGMEPVEKHNSGFMSPMIMFPTFPHNDAFVESRELVLTATPVDTQANVYTFVHPRQDYGVMITEDATISATIAIKTMANDNNPANDQVFALNLLLLRLAWKSKEVYINNQLINPTCNQEHELAYINFLLTQVPSGYLPSKQINLCIPDTPGHFHSIANLEDGADGLENQGARARYLACSRANEFICLDHFDIMGYNKRFVPTSFEFKIKLLRLEKEKVLFGNEGHRGTIDVRYKDLKIVIPVTPIVT